MTPEAERDLRRRSVHLRALADLRLVTLADGPATGTRLLELRTPAGLACDVALDRGGDILRLAHKGMELGWHSAADAAPYAPDAEQGLGFLRGFDGFLVTCGLDHHGVATETPADHFRYPLRQMNQHPLHGRIMTAQAEILEKRIDWQAGVIRVRLQVRQASVFGEVLEMDRLIEVSLTSPALTVLDRVTNCGFRPCRHGILYHINLGWPILDERSRLSAPGWALEGRLDAEGAVPDDAHVEVVDVAPSPPSGRIRLTSPGTGRTIRLDFEAEALPATALWQAFQSGTFALGIEPQTLFPRDGPQPMLSPDETRSYRLQVTIDDPDAAQDQPPAGPMG